MMFSHSSTTDGGGVSFNFLVVVREKIREEFAFVVTEVAHTMIFFISLFLSRGVAKGRVWCGTGPTGVPIKAVVSCQSV